MTDGHKVEGCRGRWIDIGTLQHPWLQKCAECRATRQKPVDDGDILDVQALAEREARHMQGLGRLKADLEADARVDPLHQDEEGFWFWDQEMTTRYGPFEDSDAAETAYSLWLDEMINRGTGGGGLGKLWLVVIAIALIAAIVLSRMASD